MSDTDAMDREQLLEAAFILTPNFCRFRDENFDVDGPGAMLFRHVPLQFLDDEALRAYITKGNGNPNDPDMTPHYHRAIRAMQEKAFPV